MHCYQIVLLLQSHCCQIALLSCNTQKHTSKLAHVSRDELCTYCCVERTCILGCFCMRFCFIFLHHHFYSCRCFRWRLLGSIHKITWVDILKCRQRGCICILSSSYALSFSVSNDFLAQQNWHLDEWLRPVSLLVQDTRQQCASVCASSWCHIDWVVAAYAVAQAFLEVG